MQRFWIRWSSGYESTQAFEVWITGAAASLLDGGERYQYDAVIEGSDRESVWHRVMRHYPDADEHFVKEVSLAWLPANLVYPYRARAS